MDEDDRSEWLAGRLAAGVAALRGGRFHEAVPLLIEVCDDPEMTAAADMVDLRARALSLCGEALLGAGRLEEAAARIEIALGLARNLGDTEGVQDIEGLRERVRRASESRVVKDPHAESIAARTIAEIEAGARDPVGRGELLIRKANAEIEAGRLGGAVAAAEAALRAAPKVPRVAVLARLSLARAVPERAERELRAAVEIARDAHEFTLVGLVARTAELLGVRLDDEPLAGR